MKKTLSALLVILTTAAAQAADETCTGSAMGMGSEASCADWQAAREAGDERVVRYVEWVGGFLSARGLYGPGRGTALDNVTLTAMIDQECRQGKVGFLHSAAINIGTTIFGPYHTVCQRR